MNEEAFSAATLSRMLCVERARTSDFLSLVEAAGLDPQNDFRFMNLRGIDIRGCDLRDFDFTGADLRGAIIDEHTLFPELERFEGAHVDFIELESKEPIVEMMRRIESAPIGQRTALLSALIRDYDSQQHVDEFLLRLANKAKSADELIDILPYWSQYGLIDHQMVLLPKLADVLARELQKAEPRKKVGGRSKWSSISSLLTLIEQMPIDVARELATRYRRGEISIEDVRRGLSSRPTQRS